MCADGHTYERAAITTWLQSHNTSPLTNVRLAHKKLSPNLALRNAIQEWQSSRPPNPPDTNFSIPWRDIKINKRDKTNKLGRGLCVLSN
jgi:hypothetical protein